MHKRKKIPPTARLSGIEHAIYALLTVLVIALSLLVWPLFAHLHARVEAADRDVLLHSTLFFRTEHVSLLRFASVPFAVWLLMFGLTCVIPAWANRRPLFRGSAKGGKKKKTTAQQLEDRRLRKKLLWIGIPLLVLSLTSIFPRHVLHTDFTLESRGVFNTVRHAYGAEEIDALEIKTYQAAYGARSVSYSYGIRVACTMEDGREYAFLIERLDDEAALRAVLAMRDALPAEAVSVRTPIPLETLLEKEAVSEASEEVIRKFFET